MTAPQTRLEGELMTTVLIILGVIAGVIVGGAIAMGVIVAYMNKIMTSLENAQWHGEELEDTKKE